MKSFTRAELVMATAIGGLMALAVMLAMAVWVLLGRLAEHPAAVAAVESAAPREVAAPMPVPLPDVQATPEWSAPQWAEKLAKQISDQERNAQRKRIEEQYVADALDRLDRGGDPGMISNFIDRALDPEKMGKGDAGTFATMRVLQIHGEDSFLANVDGDRFGPGETVFVTGMSTADLADGRTFKGRETAFEVLGPISYFNTVGAKKTVMAVRAIDATDARKAARAKVKEAWRERLEKAKSGPKPRGIPVTPLTPEEATRKSSETDLLPR